MKNSRILIAAAALVAIVSFDAFSQASTTQSLTLAVNAVYRIAVSGNPAAMTITAGTAGTDALTQVTDNSTTYSITQNVGALKITAQLSTAMAAGYTLEANLASTNGTSGGYVDLSDATPKNVVTAIARGADAAKSISYRFSALASAGTLTSTARTVTLTLTP
jgi:hypothetical protein